MAGKRKAKSAYVCSDCGAEHPQWQGQCVACSAWNTLTRVSIGPIKEPVSRGYAGSQSEVRLLGEVEREEINEQRLNGCGNNVPNGRPEHAHARCTIAEFRCACAAAPQGTAYFFVIMMGRLLLLAAVVATITPFPASAKLLLRPPRISTVGLTCLYAVVPNCQVPLRHALIGGVFAASTFTLARMVFTAVMAKSSYTLVYGAFAAVPLFLLWIYVTWIIVLTGGVLAHSLSSYQTEEQAQTPTLMKALDILYLFWRAQKEGRGIAELEVLRANDVLPGGIDADSWRRIRDTLISAQLLKRLDRGHYLLSRDLHHFTLAELADLLRAEPTHALAEHAMPWQKTAAALLQDNLDQESSLLATPLAELFATAQSPSA